MKKRAVLRYVRVITNKLSAALAISLILGLGVYTAKVATEQKKLNATATPPATQSSTGLPISQPSTYNLSTESPAQESTPTPTNVSSTMPRVSTPAPSVSSYYKAPVCTYRSIPYKTVYKDASWLDAGKTQEFSGMNGEEKICSSTAGGAPVISTVYSPYDKTVYVGTYVKPTYNYTPAPSYSTPKNYSICNQFLGSSAYDQCVYAVNSQ